MTQTGGVGRKVGALALVVAFLFSACVAPVTAPSASPERAGATPPVKRGISNAVEVVLQASGAQTANNTGNLTNVSASQLFFVLDITVASGTTPTLNVYIQTTEDGTNWCDVAAYAQATAVSRQIIRVVTSTTPNTAQVACTDATLTAGSVHQGPLGRAVRAKSVIGGTTPSFSYSVKSWAVD